MKKFLLFFLLACGSLAQTIAPIPGVFSLTPGSGSGGSGTVTSASFTGGLISVATATTTPAFTVAGTSGGVPYFSSGTTWGSSGALILNALVIGGGAGGAPSTTTTGAGILTFIGTPTSANLASAVTDETGSGSLVFGTSPAITTSLTSPSTTFALLNVTPQTINAFANATTINMGNAAGTTNLLGSLNLNPSGSASGIMTLNGVTSGKTVYTTADATAQTVTVTTAAQTVGGSTLTVPDQAGTSRNYVFDTLTQTLTNKTLTTAVLGSSTSTTQAIGDTSTKVANDAFVNNASLSPPTVDATTTHALVLADGFPGSNYITMTSASANTVNIPLNATQAFPLGTTIYVKQGGTGATSITTTGGVTPNSNGNLLTLPGQNTVAQLVKNATDTWDIYGTGPIVTYPATTAINTLLYSSAANTISATAATINNAVIITGAGGIPGPSTTLPSGLTIPAPIFSTGATASGSGNFDLSGSSGTFITSTGAATIGPGAVGITGALTITGPAATTALTLTQTARTSGILPYIKYTIPTDTTLTVATEAPGIQGITGTRQWATGGGTLALQREIFFPGPTYSAAAAMTITDGFNMYLTPPVPGTNMTVTRNHTLGIVDSTAANSSTTGAFVVANTLGTASSSVSIGNGQVNAGGTVAVGGNLVVSGKNTNYSNVTTAGWGLPAIYAAGRSTAQTAAVASVSTYTCGAADGSFEVSANVLVTTSTTHAFTCTCTYTDEGNTARTLTFTFSNVGGTLLTSIANTGGAVPYEGIPLHIRAKASTAITIGTTGTFTSVTYNVEGVIKQLL